jgi:uncharacterized protein YbjT (DUF2867 family)
MILPEGGKVKMQPVWVNDVAEAVVRAIPEWGRTYDVAGPEEKTLREIADNVSTTIQHAPQYREVPQMVARGLGAFVEMFPNPPTSMDEVVCRSEDTVLDPATNNLLLQDLGVEPTFINDIAFEYMHRYRTGGHFVELENQ